MKAATDTREDHVKRATESLLAAWETGDMPAAITRNTIARQAGDAGHPCDQWSLGNYLLMLFSGTEDARGFRQWEGVGRKVKKGAKAIRILGPCKIKKTNPTTGEDYFAIIGFKAIPVFRLEDTEGEPVETFDYSPPAQAPLANVAEAWGLQVTYGPKRERDWFWGWYNGKQIHLVTHDVKTLFHELAHAAHERVVGKLKGGQDAHQEIVAETCAAVLCRLYGFEGWEVHARDYVASYAGCEPKAIARQMMKHLGDIQKSLELILTTAAELAENEVAA